MELQQTDPKQLRQKLEHALVVSHEQAATEAVLRREHVREADKEKRRDYGIDFEATKKAIITGQQRGEQDISSHNLQATRIPWEGG